MKYVNAMAAAVLCIAAVADDRVEAQQSPRSEKNVPSLAEDGVPAAGPAGLRVEFENDAVVVIRVRMAAHEKTPMHDLTPRVVVWLTEATLRETFADGQVHEEHHQPGETTWVSARRHAGENLSDHPIEFLGIVPK